MSVSKHFNNLKNLNSPKKAKDVQSNGYNIDVMDGPNLSIPGSNKIYIGGQFQY